MSDVIVTLDEVVHRYGAVTALDRVSFELRRGEMFGLIGPDGAGKTTALRSVLGLLSPAAGRIRVFGEDPWTRRRALSARVGYLSQRFSIYGDLTVDENIAFFAEAHGMRGWRPRREELLERLRLLPFRTRLADRLSGGMKQKLALACTLVHTPELLVMDEPTTGVDPVSRREFWRILSELEREGLTLLVTTPYLDEAERCQRVGLIDGGNLLVVDTPDAIRASTPRTMLEVIARPRRSVQEHLRASAGVSEVKVFGERMHVTLATDAATEAAADTGTEAAAEESLRSGMIGAGLEVDSIRPIVPSLEDVFIARLRARGAVARSGALTALLLAGLAGGFGSGTFLAPFSISVARAAEGNAAADSLALSLSDAIARARAQSPRLEALDARVDAARGTRQEARSARYPSLSLSAGYSRLSDVPAFSIKLPTGTNLELFPNLVDRYRARAAANWPLYTGGRVGALVDAAAHQLDASASDRAAGDLDLVLETTNAYWALVTAREEVRAATHATRTLDAHLADARKRVEVGLAARSDLLAVEVERDRAELSRLSAVNRAENAEENLGRLLGVASATPIAPREPLASDAPAPESVTALVELAKRTRPDRLALAARVEAARSRARATVASRLPQAALTAGYDYARPNSRYTPPSDEWNDSWDVSLNLSLDLFDGGRASGATRAARGEAAALRAQLDDFDQRIATDVAARARDLETASAAAHVAESAVASATENLRVNQDRYREGVIASSDLLDAETSLLRAELDLTSARARVKLAQAVLDRTVGR